MFQPDRLNNELSFWQKVKALDYILLTSVFLLSTISLFVMYSTDGGEILYHTKSHFSKIIIFFPLMIFIAFFNIKWWHNFSYLFYIVVILLLIYVSFFGIKSSGSRRWMDLYLFNLQPSELMKIAIILCLAKYYHRVKIENVNSLTSIITVLTIILVPIFMVLSQPDLGTSILIASSALIILWLGGVKIKYFIYSFIVFLISLPFVISFLKPYQKLRILTFLDPDRDPLGAGYQIIQSKIAIGSGGLDGKGFLKGTQSYLDFLPEKHTDFIFTLFSEEFGFHRISSFINIIFNYNYQNFENRSNIKKYFLKVILFWICLCNFYLYCCKSFYGSRFVTYSWLSTSNNVLWRIFNARYHDWFWHCIEC
jgi:rod shape determining protein RodA